MAKKIGVQDLWFHTTGANKGQPTTRNGQGNRYRVRWDNPATGSRQEKTFPDGAKRAAAAYAAEKTQQLNAGCVIDDTKGEMRMTAYAQQWLDSLSVRDSSRARMRAAFNNQIKPSLGHERMRAPDTTAVQRFIRQLEVDGLAPTTIRYTYKILAAMYRRAVKDRVVPFTPCEDIRLPEMSDEKYWIPENWQTIALIEAAPARYRLAVAIGSGCGLRRGEVYGLCKDDFDFENMRIRVDSALIWPRGEKLHLGPLKTKKSRRWVPMSELVAQAARDHFEAGYSGETMIIDKTVSVKAGETRTPVSRHLVFVSERGGPIQASAIGKAWKAAKAAVPDMKEDFDFHGLRHFYASSLIVQNCNPREVQELLGHASVITTLQTYTHVWESSKDKSRDIMGAAFAAGADEWARRQADMAQEANVALAA